MIRINLLAAERPQAGGKKASAAPGAMQAYIIVGGLAALGLLISGAAWFWMGSQIAEVDSEIGKAKTRQAQLQETKKQVEELEKKRNSAKIKLGLIEDLRSSQKSAVRLLDEVSQALPDLLWLTQAEQSGPTVRFSGQANTLNAVAQFMDQLQRRGDGCDPKVPAARNKCWFPEVTLVTSTAQKNAVSFQLTASFQNPEVAARAAKKAAEDKANEKAAAGKSAAKK
ncbi:MAG: PilN domain-containing protein [Vicinamibacteria bacterium]|jgi:type IV pilus assembly protein PilN|nr:PilN domain-containing protein [Vicinamibacteria bacterium]